MARSNSPMIGTAGRVKLGPAAVRPYQPRVKRPIIPAGGPDVNLKKGFRAAAKAQGAPPAAPRKPGLGASNPATPAAKAAAPQGQHAAPDSLYNAQVDTTNRGEEARLGDLGGSERALKFDFGIDDPTNPFSRVEGLKRSFLAQRKAASANLAAQGQLYSGTHERALARSRLGEEKARAELRAAFDQAMGQIGSARTGVKFDSEQARNQAFEDWLTRAPAAEDSSAPADASAPAAAAPKPPAKPASGSGGLVGTVTNTTAGLGSAGVNQLLSDLGPAPRTATQNSPNTASGSGRVQGAAQRLRNANKPKANRPKARPKARAQVRAGAVRR